jgi:hypothetical protein
LLPVCGTGIVNLPYVGLSSLTVGRKNSKGRNQLANKRRARKPDVRGAIG